MVTLFRILTAVVCLTLTLSGYALAGNSALEGSRWKLIASSSSSIDPAKVTITARFAGGQISGNSGVNNYGGQFKAGPGSAFSAELIAGGQMGGPKAEMQAESTYLTLLGEASSFKISDGKLKLYNKAGKELLIFERTDE